MRLALALCATLACAQAAAAQTVEDRYGPPRPRAHPNPQQVATLAPYQGRLLSWSSKAPAPTPTEPVAAPQPEPVRPAADRSPPIPVAAAPAPPAPPAPHAQPIPITAAAPPPAPARQPAVAHLPDSLYAPPPAAQPAPQRVAAAPPATPAPVGSRTHFYSVHREYGLAPDAIPAPSQANRYVLIGPPDGAEAPRKTDDDAEDRPF